MTYHPCMQALAVLTCDLHQTNEKLRAKIKEVDDLRTVLNDILHLVTAFPNEDEDWRKMVKEKVILALHGKPAWKER